MSHTQQFITERRYLKNVSAKTIVWYEQSFKAFEGAMESKAAIVARIAELRQRNVSAISVNTYLRCINAYLRWRHTEHGEPLLKIPRLKEEQKVLATLSAEQVKRIIQYRPKGTNMTRAHTVALVLLDTGLRINECLTLAKQDVDLDNLILRVKGKGSVHRLVPFSLELRKHLYRYLKGKGVNREADIAFGTTRGTKLTTRNLQRDLKELCRQCGIVGVRCSPHTFRHSFAVGYLRAGGNLFYLSKILGHTSTRTTERYLQSLGIEDLSKVHNGLSLLNQMR